jgi:glycosyltransferase involved in cell wall biosynthesis
VRIALDATYSVDPQPTGIGIYSQALLNGLAETYPRDDFLHCYRPKQFFRAVHDRRRNVQRKLLQPPLPTFRAELFHALNQRIDRRPAKNVVTTFHDLFVMTEDYSSDEFRARFTKQARRAAQNSDLIIAVSHFTAKQVSSLLLFDPSRIRVVPHGVTLPPPELQRRREKIVLFAGVLQRRKNVIRLVEAFESIPGDWRLMLAGAATGYGAESILQRIHSSKSRDRIQILGYVPSAELSMLYLQASVFAFPSLDEGFGIPVLEAMAHGLPVIASNRPAVVEVAGDAAVLVDPYRTEDLACALQRLVHDPGLRDDYAERGRKRTKAYPWERAIRETYSVYSELLR